MSSIGSDRKNRSMYDLASVHAQFNVDCGAYLKQAVDSEVETVRARALRSVGEIRRQDLMPMLTEHLQDEDFACRFWSAWSATLLGDANALETLQGFVAESGSGAALSLALRAMDKSSAMRWVRDLNGNAAFRRLVVEAAGIIGDPVSVPWLIASMQTPELAWSQARVQPDYRCRSGIR